ncbi:hypothetical protein ACH4L7_01795 [Streptomyces anulatus]
MYHAPAFWVFLPLVALGYLTWGAVRDPGGPRWAGAVFDETVEGEPWDFWPVWAGVGTWLLIAIGVLIHRAGSASVVRADNQRIFEHGVAHSLHRTPFDTDDGEGGSRPTFIALDHRIADDRAARLHAALHAWLSRDDVQDALASAAGPGVIPSGELFGPDAVGGCVLHSTSDLGGADGFAAHRWALITQPRDVETTPNVTTVPLEPKLRKIRAKLRRKAARRDAR